jgi:hypothetical protein
LSDLSDDYKPCRFSQQFQFPQGIIKREPWICLMPHLHPNHQRWFEGRFCDHLFVS